MYLINQRVFKFKLDRNGHGMTQLVVAPTLAKREKDHIEEVEDLGQAEVVG